MARLGFHVDRTITIEGPFERHPHYVDVKGAQATVETQGTTHRVAVLISGQSELAFVGSGENGRPTDEEREEARALFAIIELAQRSTEDFKRPEPHLLASVRVEVPRGPDSGPSSYREMWSVPSIRKHEHLRGFTVNRDGSRWVATPNP
jgi:hypothetical protein